MLDPVVTGPGGTVEGRIYRGQAQDGIPTQYLFGQTPSAFDNTIGLNSGDF
ncbi:MAG: hypothetical protein JNM70_27345, partial [Anaerolineae bacterium]|nr:hypothetical protein [Anaerolineae bacterium]